jgi:hypothetical protein
MHKQGAINPATITWRRSHGRILCIEDRWRIRGEGLASLELKSTCVLSVFDASLGVAAATVARCLPRKVLHETSLLEPQSSVHWGVCQMSVAQSQETRSAFHHLHIQRRSVSHDFTCLSSRAWSSDSPARHFHWDETICAILTSCRPRAR